MPKKGYWGVALPLKIVDEVKKEIEREDSLYNGIADFVKQAVREKLERLADGQGASRQI
jgi:Arc/MetJ-type ribon-helix-helix transcriptional regulator